MKNPNSDAEFTDEEIAERKQWRKSVRLAIKAKSMKALNALPSIKSWFTFGDSMRRLHAIKMILSKR